MNKDWFECRCLISWIIVASATAVCVSCQELTSTLREGNHTCPGEEVIFTCTVRGSPTLTSLTLAWSSVEYIGQDNLLQFTTLDMPGMNVSSVINGNVTAIVTNNANIDGVPTLISELRIVADQASTVTCTVQNGGEASKEFYITAVPEAPQNVRAAETTQPVNSICIILVTWIPPAGILQSDIDHYTVYVSSGSTVNETTAIALLRVPNCQSNDISIQVTTVTRFGCTGRNSSEVRPILLTINTQTAPPTSHSEESNITPEPVDEPAISTPVIAAILVVCVIFLVSVTILIIAVVLVIFKGRSRKIDSGAEYYLEMEEREEDIKLGILRSLEELYRALKAQTHDQESVKEAVTHLSEYLKKPFASHNIVRKALKNTVKTINRQTGEEFRRALEKLMNSVDISSISGGMKIIVETLHTAAGTDKHEETIEELRNVLMGWAKSDEIKVCLQKLCDKLLEDESQKRLQEFCEKLEDKSNYEKLEGESKLNTTEVTFIEDGEAS